MTVGDAPFAKELPPLSHMTNGDAHDNGDIPRKRCVLGCCARNDKGDRGDAPFAKEHPPVTCMTNGRCHANIPCHLSPLSSYIQNHLRTHLFCLRNVPKWFPLSLYIFVPFGSIISFLSSFGIFELLSTEAYFIVLLPKRLFISSIVSSAFDSFSSFCAS